MVSARPEDLYARMLNLPLWVVTTRPARGPGLAAVLPAHLEYQVTLERAGKLFGAGPIFEDGDDAPPTAGMIILRAGSGPEARALADGDPFHRAGLRRYTLHRWVLNEGGLTFGVRFSDQSVSLL